MRVNCKDSREMSTTLPVSLNKRKGKNELLMKRFRRRLFTVEEHYQNTLKEYKEYVDKSEKVISPTKHEKQALAVKIHSLEKQLEQV